MVDASKALCSDGASLLGLTTTRIEDVSSFGTVAGTWLEETAHGGSGGGGGGGGGGGEESTNIVGGSAESRNNSKGRKGSTIQITHFVEKPTSKEELEELQMDRIDQDQRLTIFGLYIINDPKSLYVIFLLQSTHMCRSGLTAGESNPRWARSSS